MNSSTNETTIGRQLMAGGVLAGAAAAGNPEARWLVTALAEAEIERVRAARRAHLEEEFLLRQMKGQINADSERQLRAMADDFRRAVAVAAVRAEAQAAGVRDPWPGRRQHPGTPAHRRHRRRA